MVLIITNTSIVKLIYIENISSVLYQRSPTRPPEKRLFNTLIPKWKIGFCQGGDNKFEEKKKQDVLANGNHSIKLNRSGTKM